MTNKRILYIAVVYNNFDDTQKLCQSLADQAPADYELTCVLVDNSDAREVIDGVLKLADDFQFVKVLRPEKNAGYFPAISLALQQYADGYDYVVAGNNDLIYDPLFSTKLAQKTYDAPIMVVCPDIVTADGVHQNPHHQHKMSKWQKLYFDIYFSHYFVSRGVGALKQGLMSLLGKKKYFLPNAEASAVAGVIDTGVGACYVFLPAFLKAAQNTLYYEWFLYGEEACLGWQVRNLDGTIWYDPDLEVWHAESATLSKIPSRRTYEFARTAHWGYRKIV